MTISHIQMERLLDIADRYVTVEETKLKLTVEQLKFRNEQDERVTKAQEKLAEGMIVTGSVSHSNTPVSSG